MAKSDSKSDGGSPQGFKEGVNAPEVGRLVRAKAGRDNGKYFVIISTEGEYVKIADGKHRRLSCPKLKKLKHLALTAVVLTGIAEKLKTGIKVYDAELYSAVRKALAELQAQEIK